MTRWQKYAPTNKWWVATITSGAAIVLMVWAGGGIHTVADKTAVVGFVASRLVAYVARNSRKPVPPPVD